MGADSEMNAAVVIRKRGGQIIVGDDCLIYGSLTTETEHAKLSIGNNVYVGDSIIAAALSVTLEDDVLVSGGCLIQDSDNHNLRYSIRKNDCRDWKRGRLHNWDVTPKAPIRICRGAWIGAKSIVLKGVTIGVGSVVGAGSVVTRDVASYTVVAGNPARFIKQIDDGEPSAWPT